MKVKARTVLVMLAFGAAVSLVTVVVLRFVSDDAAQTPPPKVAKSTLRASSYMFRGNNGVGLMELRIASGEVSGSISLATKEGPTVKTARFSSRGIIRGRDLELRVTLENGDPKVGRNTNFVAHANPNRSLSTTEEGQSKSLVWVPATEEEYKRAVNELRDSLKQAGSPGSPRSSTIVGKWSASCKAPSEQLTSFRSAEFLENGTVIWNENDTGTYSLLEGSRILVHDAGGTVIYNVSLSGDTLTISGGNLSALCTTHRIR